MGMSQYKHFRLFCVEHILIDLRRLCSIYSCCGAFVLYVQFAQTALLDLLAFVQSPDLYVMLDLSCPESTLFQDACELGVCIAKGRGGSAAEDGGRTQARKGGKGYWKGNHS